MSPPLLPLLTLTTGDRVGPERADRAVGLQVAASSAGAAVLPTAMGVLIQQLGPTAPGPALLGCAVLLGGAYCGLDPWTGG